MSFTIVWVGGRVTEYITDVVHLTKTYKFYKTQLCKFRFKGCTLPLSAALQHISCQGVALYFNYTLPRLFVLYSLHFMYTIVLYTSHAYVPIHVHVGTGGAEWSPLVETIVLPHLTCPRLVLGRHLFVGPLPGFESTPPIIRVVHPLSGIVF